MNISEHSSKKYDAELEILRASVMQMGGLVQAQIMTAIDAFINGNQDLLEKVIADDHSVNGLEVNIDEECAQIVVRRQPAAVDLRLIMAVSKIVTDLERIGDEAAKIARIAKVIHQRDHLNSPRISYVREVADVALDMLRGVLDAFARLDAVKAAAIVREDQVIDDRFRGIMRQLITYMLEDPRTITSAFDIVFIAKAIERIGDHAKNIAESVIYIVKGKDVRHIALDQLERAARSSAP
ncbi:MAG: phosphate signaling complex protein PhoU [Sterolibacteriaceae bacterium MAG5]|nr:phosphate signaling complex protein PhoU [Candidatus Nitricoxidireducens bremensis]